MLNFIYPQIHPGLHASLMLLPHCLWLCQFVCYFLLTWFVLCFPRTLFLFLVYSLLFEYIIYQFAIERCMLLIFIFFCSDSFVRISWGFMLKHVPRVISDLPFYFNVILSTFSFIFSMQLFDLFFHCFITNTVTFWLLVQLFVQFCA